MLTSKSAQGVAQQILEDMKDQFSEAFRDQFLETMKTARLRLGMSDSEIQELYHPRSADLPFSAFVHNLFLVTDQLTAFNHCDTVAKLECAKSVKRVDRCAEAFHNGHVEIDEFLRHAIFVMDVTYSFSHTFLTQTLSDLLPRALSLVVLNICYIGKESA